MRDHVKILAWCFIVYSGLLLLCAIAFFVILSGAGALSGDRQVMLITGAVGMFLSAIFLLLAIPGLITGFGLLKYRPWSRILAIILGVLNLLSFPLGTALGIYALVVLLNVETEQLFREQATPAVA